MGYLKKVNAKRKRRLWLKHFGSKAYRTMVVDMDCLVSRCARRPIDPHHWPTTGSGRGTYRDLTPLCSGLDGHHTEFHSTGQATFQEKYGLDLKAAAEKIYRAGRHLVGGES